ncbi:hypothetical protein Acr_12g0004680 [Actinidia rufa]|uniref:Uncharacterized protein n=1 Tax=Actinidia rufa TaxID=165716 RepID=A0A7J0FJ39_9ERIC|nr:hypothetical protein Acr_12g0004680 [Actinidia rufa]
MLESKEDAGRGVGACEQSCEGSIVTIEGREPSGDSGGDSSFEAGGKVQNPPPQSALKKGSKKTENLRRMEQFPKKTVGLLATIVAMGPEEEEEGAKPKEGCAALDDTGLHYAGLDCIGWTTLRWMDCAGLRRYVTTLDCAALDDAARKLSGYGYAGLLGSGLVDVGALDWVVQAVQGCWALDWWLRVHWIGLHGAVQGCSGASARVAGMVTRVVATQGKG